MVGKTYDFRSDNVASAAPEILDALVRSNSGTAASYGDDEVSRQVQERFSALFEAEVHVIPVATGTAANAIGLSALTPPYGAIYCHKDAHIETSEIGATEFFTGGAKLTTLEGAQGRLAAVGLAAALAGAGGLAPKPSVVSVTQATELGTLYAVEELKAIGDVARSHGLYFHMDGARLANALAALGCTPAQMTWRTGVDMLSFGVTKNGGLNADALVVFNPALVEGLRYRLRRAGQTWSKMRFAAAQLLAYVEDDRYLRFAGKANALAKRLGDGLCGLPRLELLAPVEANEVFVSLPSPVLVALEAAGFLFMRWGSDAARFVCRFDGSMAEVDALVGAVRQALAGMMLESGNPFGVSDIRKTRAGS